jgi:hypothetical protein
MNYICDHCGMWIWRERPHICETCDGSMCVPCTVNLCSGCIEELYGNDNEEADNADIAGK